MSDDSDQVAALLTIPWYKSSLFRNGLISAVGLIGVIAHITIKKDVADAIADLVVLGITLYFTLHSLYTRAKKPIPPIALTKAKADAINVPPVSVELATDAQTDPLDQPSEKLT